MDRRGAKGQVATAWPVGAWPVGRRRPAWGSQDLRKPLIVQIRAAGAVVGAPDEIDRARATFAPVARIATRRSDRVWALGRSGRSNRGADFCRRVHENESSGGPHASGRHRARGSAAFPGARSAPVRRGARGHWLRTDRRLRRHRIFPSWCGPQGRVAQRRGRESSGGHEHQLQPGGPRRWGVADTRRGDEGANRGRGDGLLFAISPALEHRVRRGDWHDCPHRVRRLVPCATQLHGTVQVDLASSPW